MAISERTVSLLGYELREIVLPSGFTVYHVNTTEFSSIYLELSVAVGWSDDGRKTGITHLLEHMLISGENTAYKKRITELVLKGISFDAVTTADCMKFIQKAPPSSSIKQMIDCLYRTLFFDFSLPNEERLEQEKKTVLQEIATQDTSALCGDFIGEIYDSRSRRVLEKIPMGTPEDVKKISSDDLYKFYRKHFRSSNCYLFVFGNVDSESLLEALKFSDPKLFKAIKFKRKTGKIFIPETHYLDFSEEEDGSGHDDDMLMTVCYFQCPVDIREKLYLAMATLMVCGHPFSFALEKFRFQKRYIYSMEIQIQRVPTPRIDILFEAKRKDTFEIIQGLVEFFDKIKDGEYSKELLKSILKEREDILRRGRSFDDCEALSGYIDQYRLYSIEFVDLFEVFLHFSEDELRNIVSRYCNEDTFGYILLQIAD